MREKTLGYNLEPGKIFFIYRRNKDSENGRGPIETTYQAESVKKFRGMAVIEALNRETNKLEQLEFASTHGEVYIDRGPRRISYI